MEGGTLFGMESESCGEKVGIGGLTAESSGQWIVDSWKSKSKVKTLRQGLRVGLRQ